MILVYGLGNPLRGDDGAGARVAEWLANDLPPSVGVRVYVRTALQLLPEMAEEIRSAEAVLLIDAAVGGPPVARRRVASDAPGALPASHHLTAESLAGLTKRLWGCSPEMYLITIRGERFNLGERLSEPVLHRSRRAHRLAAALLQRLMR